MKPKKAKEPLKPIITRIRTPQTVTVGGRTFVAEETILRDYGELGVTKVYIEAGVDSSPAQLARFLKRQGYDLLTPEGKVYKGTSEAGEQ